MQLAIANLLVFMKWIKY